MDEDEQEHLDTLRDVCNGCFELDAMQSRGIPACLWALGRIKTLERLVQDARDQRDNAEDEMNRWSKLWRQMDKRLTAIRGIASDFGEES